MVTRMKKRSDGEDFIDEEPQEFVVTHLDSDEIVDDSQYFQDGKLTHFESKCAESV